MVAKPKPMKSRYSVSSLDVCRSIINVLLRRKEYAYCTKYRSTGRVCLQQQTLCKLISTTRLLARACTSRRSAESDDRSRVSFYESHARINLCYKSAMSRAYRALRTEQIYRAPRIFSGRTP